jgi:hypothetical protein
MKNVAASVRDRLMNQSRASGVSFSALMERFVIGRLLWRISQSAEGRQFVLKGALEHFEFPTSPDVVPRGDSTRHFVMRTSASPCCEASRFGIR